METSDFLKSIKNKIRDHEDCFGKKPEALFLNNDEIIALGEAVLSIIPDNMRSLEQSIYVAALDMSVGTYCDSDCFRYMGIPIKKLQS